MPDATYERVTRRARELGISRSQLFTQAADQFLAQLDAVGLTQQIDAALSRLLDRDDSAVAASAVGRRVLDQAAGEW